MDSQKCLHIDEIYTAIFGGCRHYCKHVLLAAQLPIFLHVQQARSGALKVLLPQRPRQEYGKWHYDAIVVFDKVIAFISWPNDKEWIILRDEYLRPEKYVDAVFTSGWSDSPHRIYAVTEPSGDVRVWSCTPGVSHVVIYSM